MKNTEIKKLEIKATMLNHVLKLTLDNGEEEKIIKIQKEIQDIKEQIIKLSLE
jgi:hypothetical protein